jgi:hypothetical protein
MLNPKITKWGFTLAGLLFAVAALVPLLRGGTLDVVFLALSIVFFTLGPAIAKKTQPTDKPPAA